MTKRQKWILLFLSCLFVAGAAVFDAGNYISKSRGSSVLTVSAVDVVGKLDYGDEPRIYRLDKGDVKGSLADLKCLPDKSSGTTRILLVSDSETLYAYVSLKYRTDKDFIVLYFNGKSGVYSCRASPNGPNLTTVFDEYGVGKVSEDNFVRNGHSVKGYLFVVIEIPRGLVIDNGRVNLQVVHSSGLGTVVWFHDFIGIVEQRGG